MSCRHVLFEEEGRMEATKGRCYLVGKVLSKGEHAPNLASPVVPPGDLGQKELSFSFRIL